MVLPAHEPPPLPPFGHPLPLGGGEGRGEGAVGWLKGARRAQSSGRSLPGERFPGNDNSRVEIPEPMENIEHPTSNLERRSERGFALSFDVRRWMFDVGCSSGFMESLHGLCPRIGTMNQNGTPLPALSPQGGERVAEGRERGGSWRASIRFCARIGTMNRCASQRRGPDRGSATRSLLGSWKDLPETKLRALNP